MGSVTHCCGRSLRRNIDKHTARVCVYTLCVYTLCVYTLCVYTLCVYTLCVYTLCVYTLCVYTLTTDTKCAYIKKYHSITVKSCEGPFMCYVTLFSGNLTPTPPPRNANNVEPYTFVTLFSGKADTPPPTALRNT